MFDHYTLTHLLLNVLGRFFSLTHVQPSTAKFDRNPRKVQLEFCNLVDERKLQTHALCSSRWNVREIRKRRAFSRIHIIGYESPRELSANRRCTRIRHALSLGENPGNEVTLWKKTWRTVQVPRNEEGDIKNICIIPIRINFQQRGEEKVVVQLFLTVLATNTIANMKIAKWSIVTQPIVKQQTHCLVTWLNPAVLSKHKTHRK